MTKMSLLIAGVLLWALAGSSADSVKPNIILILADDLGWADTSLTGKGYYQTPNLERLAKRGVYFPNAYSASPLCSPTRASIMSGQNPARTGFTAPVGHEAKEVMQATVNARAKPGDRQRGCASITRLSTDHLTFAEVLKQGGYATGHFGKWHIGREPFSPLQHGFDVDIPHWPGPGPAGSFVAPWKFPSFKERYPQEHIEDRMGDEAVAFMEANKERPFYVNYWQFSVHAPFDAKAELIEKYRKTRDPNCPQQSPTYAAMVQSLDDNVGKMLDALDRMGLTDKTIILFYSDNGGNMYDQIDGTAPTSNAPLRGGKASMYEGGIRVPALVSWPGVTQGGTVCEALVQSEDLYPTIVAMAGLPSQPQQALDACSMVPALRGEPGLRQQICCFFPHSPPVPEWLPPAVCLRRGEWKLIRIFHDAPDGKHRYELYDLARDIGERHNLAATEPERVAAMDVMIEKFLTETKAVVPLPNPSYDPAAIDTVRGWRAGGDARLNFSHNLFHLRSFGPAPGMIAEAPLQLAAGSYTLELRVRSWAKGPARIFWAAADHDFTGEYSAVVDFKADGIWHECTTPLVFEQAVNKIRFDPAAGDGSVTIAWIRLRNSGSGELAHEWDFAAKPQPK